MSELHIPNLTIKGFRGIKELSIGSLGRVNLITGKNNTGKSSILEALRLYAEDALSSTIYDILEFREEYVRGADPEGYVFNPVTMFHVSALFHGFPQLSETIDPIVVSTHGKLGNKWMKLGVRWFEEEIDSEGDTKLIPIGQEEESEELEELEGIPALTVETDRNRRLYRLERLAARPGRVITRSAEGPRMPCLLVSSHRNPATNALGPLWDDVTLKPGEKMAIEALQIIEPRITDVRVIGGEGRNGARKVIVGTRHMNRPVPLRSFGDGLNHLFTIILSLANARDGILLVDEFENGLHHSVQEDAWRLIFRIAPMVNAQVFATTHSNDAVKAFVEAARESPEEGTLVKLTLRGENLFATSFSEGQLATITGDQIEVR